MKARVERYLNSVWYERETAPLWLRVLEPVYRLMTTSRRRPTAQKPPCPVIVVGNITAGGSGKTPVVAAVARALLKSGHAPAVISRGYGGRVHKQPRAVTATSNPADVGDEPVMLARRAGCAVWVCKDRLAALDAARRGGANVVIADDGLQHARLPRSYEICVVDGLRGLGNGRLLPAGPLRQAVDRLEEVDLVLLKQVGSDRTTLPVAARPFAVETGRPYVLGDEAETLAEENKPAEFDAVCAIGNPESFFTLLKALGYRFRRHAFPDHHRFVENDVQALKGPLMVTEKDAVKLERIAGLPETWVLPIRARLPSDALRSIEAHVREFELP